MRLPCQMLWFCEVTVRLAVPYEVVTAEQHTMQWIV